ADVYEFRTTALLHRAAAEMIAAVGSVLAAEADASIGHLARGFRGVTHYRDAIGVVAAVVGAGAGVGAEEPVLPDRCLVVPGDPGRAARLVVVPGSDAVGVEAVDQAVAVVVDAVVALAEHAAAVERALLDADLAAAPIA